MLHLFPYVTVYILANHRRVIQPMFAPLLAPQAVMNGLNGYVEIVHILKCYLKFHAVKPLLDLYPIV